MRSLIDEYERLSPYLLLRNLPQLALNQIPPALRTAWGEVPVEAWELLETAAFFFFRQVLMLETYRLGSACLFKSEPEGIVLVNRGHKPFALLYECKARSEGYKMSSDDLLRYQDYLKRKREQIQVRYHLPLTHFTIISSSFGGEIKTRVEEIIQSGFVLSLVPAVCLMSIYDQALSRDYTDVQLLNCHRLFHSGLVDETCTLQCWDST